MEQSGFVGIDQLSSVVVETLAALEDDAETSPKAGPPPPSSSSHSAAPPSTSAAAPVGVDTAYALKFVRARVDRENMGIVLWNDFWEALCSFVAAPNPLAVFRRHFDALDNDGAGFLPNGSLGPFLRSVGAELTLESYNLVGFSLYV